MSAHIGGNLNLKSKFVLLALAACTLSAAPLRTLPGLTGVTFYELTSGVTAYTFTPNSSEITNRLAGSLGTGNRDFVGAPQEFYDVFYSDANGAANIDGEYISIEAYYAGSGAGLNIGEVQLLFGSSSSAFATSVASFVSASGFLAGNLNNIIDGNINTATGMGSTNEGRTRVTVGFAPSQQSEVPEPSSFLLGALGAAGILALRSRKR